MGSLCGADRDDFCLWTSCYKFSLCVVWIGDVIYVAGDPEEVGHSRMVEDVRLYSIRLRSRTHDWCLVVPICLEVISSIICSFHVILLLGPVFQVVPWEWFAMSF